jgi:RNA polymerase sigma-70 factor (ECF subfamily)
VTFARSARGCSTPSRAFGSAWRALDTEAVLQETLLRIWQVAPRVELDPRGDALLRLGVRIAHNLAVDHVRRDRRLARAEQLELLQAEANEPAVDGGEPDPFLRDAVRRCIEQLPKQPAAALELRIQSQGAAADETLAERLGMQLNTFLKNFGRARQFLLECLKGRGIELGIGAVNPTEGAR